MRQAQRVTVTHAVECRPMLLAIAAKATVLMKVFMPRGKLIQALSIAVSALPGHPVGDALAQTFCEQNLWVPFLLDGSQP